MIVFHGANATSSKEHWDAFMDYVRGLGIVHLDEIYKCFSLSLKKYVRNCLLGLSDNNINSRMLVEMFSLIDGWKEKTVDLF
jgi:hypothetical protein